MDDRHDHYPREPHGHLRHRQHHGRPARDDYHEELVMFLERDQFVADRLRPLEPASIGRPAQVALLALRIFVLIVGAMVVYTFVAQL